MWYGQLVNPGLKSILEAYPASFHKYNSVIFTNECIMKPGGGGWGESFTAISLFGCVQVLDS